MQNKFYVRTIVRDDNVRFDFDASEIYLSTDNTLLARPEIDSTDINYTDADGGEMIHQKLLPHEQEFKGIIYPRVTDYWTLYFRLVSFFQHNHYYKIIYKRKDGTLFAQKNAWLSRNLQLPPTAQEEYSPFTVGFKLQRWSLYEYTEDGSGNETFANTVTLPLLAAALGGEKWDAVGTEWGGVGEVWEAGGGGVQNVFVSSASTVYPTWVVVGSAVKPKLQNNTTDTQATYDGTVAAGQTLVVDFAAGKAWLDGAIVTRYLIGQVSFKSGMNLAGFGTEGGTATNSTIAWNNILG